MLVQKDTEILELKGSIQKDRQTIIDLEDKIWHVQKEIEILLLKASDHQKQLD
jgi:hypothetical protein